MEMKSKGEYFMTSIKEQHFRRIMNERSSIVFCLYLVLSIIDDQPFILWVNVHKNMHTAGFPVVCTLPVLIKIKKVCWLYFCMPLTAVWQYWLHRFLSACLFFSFYGNLWVNSMFSEEFSDVNTSVMGVSSLKYKLGHHCGTRSIIVSPKMGLLHFMALNAILKKIMGGGHMNFKLIGTSNKITRKSVYFHRIAPKI